MARVSVTVRLGTTSSVRVRSCSSTPAGVKRTCSASSASTNSRATPAGSAPSPLGRHRPGRPCAAPSGSRCGRGQEQQRAVAQAGKVTRTFGRHPYEAGGGRCRRRSGALRLCRGPQGLMDGWGQHRGGQAGLAVHGADRRPAAPERAAAEPGRAVDQVGRERLRAGGQRGAALLAAPGNEARPVAGIQLEGRRRGIGDRVADHPDGCGFGRPARHAGRAGFSGTGRFGESTAVDRQRAASRCHPALHHEIRQSD